MNLTAKVQKKNHICKCLSEKNITPFLSSLVNTDNRAAHFFALKFFFHFFAQKFAYLKNFS